MDGSFTSGSFGELVVGFSHFHDYKELPYEGSGNCKLYTVISGERKLILKAANKEKGSLTENIARLQREYKLLERLYGNEHIVRCIGWREDAEVGPCIVMEYIDGETLTDYLKSAPSSKEKKRILNELIDALGFIHKQQIVHNDLKPDNILITRNGHNVKLIDFGYADSDSNIDKATGGTKAFAAPELANREGTDVTSDIYSLGFIIKALFPHQYTCITSKCLREKSSRRYQNANEVRQALSRCEWLKWLIMSALVIGAIILLWPRKEDTAVTIPEQTEPIKQTETVSNHDTIIIQKHTDAIAEERSLPTQNDTPKTSNKQPKQVEQNDPKIGLVTNNPINSLNLDSIHQVYLALYDKFEKDVKKGMASAEIAYWDYGEICKNRFALELDELHNTMRPEDMAYQAQFEIDFKIVSEELVSKLEGLYVGKLPSIGWIGQDNPRKADSLRIECQKFYFKINPDIFNK